MNGNKFRANTVLAIKLARATFLMLLAGSIRPSDPITVKLELRLQRGQPSLI